MGRSSSMRWPEQHPHRHWPVGRQPAMAPSIGVAAKRPCGWTAGKLPCIVEPNKPGRGEKETREAI